MIGNMNGSYSIEGDVMRRYLVVGGATCVLLFSACGAVFNAPFINIEETLELQPAMTMEEVIELCGEPFYVAYGDGEVTAWAYQVRSLDVSSGGQSITEAAHSVARSRWGVTEGSGLVKRGVVRDHGDVLPDLVLVFQNNSLQYWATSSFHTWESWISE